jgi:PPOX class probable F420-dependent enzyme
VWFIVANGQLVFVTGRDSAKGRYLTRDTRAVLCVDDPQAPSFVQVQGTAATSEEPEEILDVAIRTSARYVGSERAEEFGRRNAQPGALVVRVAPTKIVAAFNIAD